MWSSYFLITLDPRARSPVAPATNATQRSSCRTVIPTSTSRKPPIFLLQKNLVQNQLRTSTPLTQLRFKKNLISEEKILKPTRSIHTSWRRRTHDVTPPKASPTHHSPNNLRKARERVNLRNPLPSINLLHLHPNSHLQKPLRYR